MNANYVVGQTLSFIYNGILRQGVVDAVKATGLVLRLDHDKDNKPFKMFSYEKMQDVR